MDTLIVSFTPSFLLAMAAAGSGYRESDGIYTSLTNPPNIPQYPHLNFVTYMFSKPFVPSKPALIDAKSGKQLTCSQVRQSVESVAAGLSKLGIKHGDVVMILLPNCIQFPLIFNGALRIGAVVTTSNPQNTLKDLARQIQDSNPRLIFTDISGQEKIKTFQRQIVLVDEESKPQRIEDIPSIPFSRLLSADAGSNPIRTDLRVRQSDPAALLYSSGTTGISKGVVISHGNLITAMAVEEQVHEEMHPDDRNLVLFPMYHVGGLIWLACGALLGGPTFLLLPRYSFIDLLRAVEVYRVNKITSAPPVVLNLLSSPETGNFELGSLKALICAAAPLGKEIMQGMLAKFPRLEMFIQLYGMTETVTVGSGGKGLLGSAGKLNASLEAKVVDLQTGKALPPGERGELWLRGPAIMQGYLNNPVATAEAIDEEGWLHTGDLVYFDNEGYLYIVDRLKELIKYKGYQVAPAELETILLTHPSIIDCGVIPFPDEAAGEVPFALVVKKPGTRLSSVEVLSFVADQVAPYKKIRKVAFVKEIPKSAAGKILRKELKVKANSKL